MKSCWNGTIVAMIAVIAAAHPAAAATCLHGRAVDSSGSPVAGAVVTLRLRGARQAETTTDRDGQFRLPCVADESDLSVVARGPGLSGETVAFGRPGPLLLVLQPTALTEQVSVTATRSAVSLGPQAQAVVALTEARLEAFPALTLDERLRQVAGFELFRRASSWVANPTSQGVSLRGLGSTAASRTLVLADGVPLNDPFGGWVHWNEIPPDAVAGVTVATGGGSDLYGSSALGGVIDLLTERPETTVFEGTLAGASEDTTDGHARLSLAQGRWGESAAGESFVTAGYIPLSPQLEGPIDRAANVHYETGRVVLERRSGPPAAPTGRLFLTGNLLNEARNNGTELQTNGTRLWRWDAGDTWAAGERANGRVTAFGSNEAYRQSFTSINAARSVETLTRLQHTPTQEVGGSADVTVPFGRVAAVAGGDVRDLRANDAEQVEVGPQAGSTQAISARQRFVGGFAEGLGSFGPWSGAASVRLDGAENLDTVTRSFSRQGTLQPSSGTRVPDRSELVVSPRVGLVRQLRGGVALHAAGFRAFRAPTMNELYRQGQVGQELTLANAQLRSERATGAEGGASWHAAAAPVSLEATYFWTEINRPVSAVLVASTPTTITNLRENLGQIQSQGVEVRSQVLEGHALSGQVFYQYAHAVVTSFSAQPALLGRWIPEVPRQSVTAQLRISRLHWGTLTAAARASGRAYDDSSNQYPLAGFFLMDVYGERSMGRGISLYVSVQNLLNHRIEVARTPLLTLGNPVLAQGGMRWSWGRSSQ